MGKTRDTANLVSDQIISNDIANDRIGIGSATPTEKLDVVGNASLKGSVRATGGITAASLSVSGISSLGNNVFKIGTGNTTAIIEGNTFVGGNVRSTGNIVASTLSVSGISTIGNVKVGTGNTTVIVEGGLRVTGVTTIVGVVTCSSNANINGSLVMEGPLTLQGNSPFYRNSATIRSNYTIGTSFNEMSIGPVVVASGVTVTVSTGARWVVI